MVQASTNARASAAMDGHQKLRLSSDKHIAAYFCTARPAKPRAERPAIHAEAVCCLQVGCQDTLRAAYGASRIPNISGLCSTFPLHVSDSLHLSFSPGLHFFPPSPDPLELDVTCGDRSGSTSNSSAL
ncbi:hypothetical protein AAFF_G00151300 [Aldrovandia affinis]|uniref:Uncharacterized protein n=1 Tax=Aldrovandia affinis TaxID=143900 RepID=A0AAD7RP00_9TELE|nr:hypothetical protein AAFF_G00151300 [Aldrovandia affinis]